MTIARHVKHASLALIALSSVGALQSAFAVGTPSGTTISNQATVDYSVGGVSQTQITSAAASFVVDSRIDLTVSEVSTNATQTTPGQTNVVTAFRVTNTGNSTQGYQLSVTNEASGATLFSQTDDQNVNNLRIFVDSNGNGTYDAGTDATTNIDTLATDADGESLVVFVVADIPVAATNGQYANVRLQARAAVAGTSGATLATQTAGADNPAAVDIVFADAGRDATESAADQYEIRSAALTVTKNAAVISDPFNGTGADRKAIPGAVIEYTIVVTNNSTTTAASAVTVNDNIPANTTFVPGSITLNAGSLPDTSFIAGPPARVAVSAGAVAASGGTATVTFRVTIDN
jgi:conserved repeat domain